MTEEANNIHPIDILLVEDDESDIKVTQRAFDRAKLKNNIYIVRDGQEALDFIYHQQQYQDKKKYPRPDLILLDIALPKMDGFDVLKRLKGDQEFNAIPVVILTSSQNDQDVAKGFGFGASSYIQKPVSFEEFNKIVDGFNFYWQIINKLPDDKRFR